MISIPGIEDGDPGRNAINAANQFASLASNAKPRVDASMGYSHRWLAPHPGERRPA